MNPPAFWSNPPERPGWQACLLAPASALWRLGARVRAARTKPGHPGVPVLCIGNLTAGGTGKTPMVAALMEHLSQRGVSAHVVSRGHGGRIEGPHLVDPLDDTAADVGDEPLMLAARGLVWIARDRLAAARAAVASGAKMILLDDGFQNPGIEKDASILMVDAGAGFGNGRVIPAGPLREPVARGLAHADLTVLVGPDRDRARVRAAWPVLASAPTVDAELSPIAAGLPLEGNPVIAFAGIGRPEKFFATLRGLGAELVETHPFPDHHVYGAQIIRRLVASARAADAMLVTTEKDAVRLPADLHSEVMTVLVRLEPADWSPIDAIVDRLTGTIARDAPGL